MQDHFSSKIDLTKQEEEAEKKLINLKNEMMKKDPAINTGFYHEKMPVLMQSPLYECLNIMPKPANLNIHFNACCPIDFMVKKFTYYNYVYFSQRDKKFIVSKKGCDKHGYVKTNQLR